MIEIGEDYKHIEKGTIYTAAVKTKVKLNGSWYEGIIYTGKDCIQTYVRTVEDFNENFVKVEP